jgi:hypothetical protein
VSEGDGQITLAEDLLLVRQIDPGSGRLTSATNLSIVLAGCWIAELVLAQVAEVVDGERLVVVADPPPIPPHLVHAVRRVSRRYHRSRGRSLSQCLALLDLGRFPKHRAKLKLLERGLLEYAPEGPSRVLGRFHDSSFRITDPAHAAARQALLERAGDDPRAYHLAALAEALDFNPWFHRAGEDPKTHRYTTAISSAVLDAMNAHMDGVMYSD